MHCVETIDELVTILKNNEPREYVPLTQNMRIPASEVERFAHWDPDRYTRNCIARNDQFELLLLCWKPGDKTPIHSHNEQRCWVHQVSGTLNEKLFKEADNGDLQLLNTHKLREGDIAYMDDSMGFHTLHNATDHRAISLHLYVAPIEECRIYDNENEAFKNKELVYDSVNGKKLKQPVKASVPVV